tara:strand:- start:7880 stop:8161 length:282 start_codon:yes stop_codon:yes gene_type:complete
VIAPEAIRKLAELSALSVSSDDEQQYAQQLTQVVAYMTVLNKHNHANSSLAWPIDNQTHTRVDHAVNIVDNLPPGFHRTADGFPVPKINTAMS